jgi:hypothetical protein
MTQSLLDVARHYAEANADANGVARTLVPGLTIIRETMPSALQYAVCKPLIAVVLQGGKRVTMGNRTFDFGAGESMLIAADVPTVSQITRATVVAPYVSLVVELDPVAIEGLVVDMGTAPFRAGTPVRVDPTGGEVADAALRLLRLLDRPASVPILQGQLLRELHFWLLSGRHGDAIRSLGVADSHARRIARAIAYVRENIATPLKIDQLADVARHERLLVPRTFPGNHVAVAAAVPEAAAVDRGPPDHAGRRRDDRQRSLCRRLREYSAVHPRIWPHVRPSARPRHARRQGQGPIGGLTGSCTAAATDHIRSQAGKRFT